MPSLGKRNERGIIRPSAQPSRSESSSPAHGDAACAVPIRSGAGRHRHPHRATSSLCHSQRCDASGPTRFEIFLVSERLVREKRFRTVIKCPQCVFRSTTARRHCHREKRDPCPRPCPSFDLFRDSLDHSSNPIDLLFAVPPCFQPTTDGRTDWDTIPR